MNDDYLWNRSGPPDPEVERLEQLLRPLGDPGTPPRRTEPRRRWWPLAVAAALALCAAGLAHRATQPRPSWQMQSGRLTLGDWLETREATHIQVDDIGQLDVAPGSRLRMASSRPGDYRVELQHGKLEALILAPPRQFFVDTPAAVAVDLGCAYTLEVDRSGETRVSVRSGWVAFERQGDEVFIPAGARCRTSPAFGLGLPVYDDAPPALHRAVARFEEAREVALPAGLRSQDGLTLWHLLGRVVPAERARVFDEFARVVMVPAAVSRERVLAGDRQALDALWSALGLGDSAFWRRWQRKLE